VTFVPASNAKRQDAPMSQIKRVGCGLPKYIISVTLLHTVNGGFKWRCQAVAPQSTTSKRRSLISGDMNARAYKHKYDVYLEMYELFF